MNCSHCGQATTPDELRDSLGNHPVPAAAPADAPAYRPAGADVLNWGTVRAGLGLVPIGLCLIFLGLAASAITSILSDQKPMPTGRAHYLTYSFILSFWAFVGGVILSGTGQCLMCATPRGSGARGPAFAGGLCLGLLFLGWVIGFFPFQQPLSGEARRALSVAFYFIGCLQFTCFMVFLSKVARRFQQPGTAAHAMVYLLVGLVLYLAVLAYNVATGVERGGLPQVEHDQRIWLYAGLGAVGLVMLVWGMIVLASVRRILSRALTG